MEGAGGTGISSIAADIAGLCPGWRAWHEGGWWHAIRAGGFLEMPGVPQVSYVRSRDVPGLIAAIDEQAGLDLAADFPGWKTSRGAVFGRWTAVRGVALGPVITVTEVTAAALHAALRALYPQVPACLAAAAAVS